MDFVLALFPWLVTWKLRIKRLEKIGICVTMSLGVIVAIISTWRTAYMMSPDLNNYDAMYFCKFTFSQCHRFPRSHYPTLCLYGQLLTRVCQTPGRQGMSLIWYQAEVAGTIIVQTLPVIRHLVRDQSVQKSLVSVELNEIATTRSSKMFDGVDIESTGHQGHSVAIQATVVKPGVDNSSREESHRKGLHKHLKPSRASWSTYSPINE